MFLGFYNLLTSNVRGLTLAGGSTVVSLWTLLRHINNGINYDVVGQIGLAQQWQHGLMSGAQLGATNYLLKMPVYLTVNAIHFIPPMDRLLLLAILFNVATFILLFFVYEKILNLYKIKVRTWLYLGTAWLATITGSVYWTDYANSRNLETVGGLWIIYLALKLFKYKQFSTIAWLFVSTSIVFYADPLQLYVCGSGITLFVMIHLILRRTRVSAIEAFTAPAITFLGFAGSQALVFLSKKFLHVTFLESPSSLASINWPSITVSTHNMAASTLNMFGADFLRKPSGFSTFRELLNAAVLTSIVILLIKLKSVSKYAANGLILTVILVNYLVYAASGQALQPTTSRYLVMVPLLLVILFVLKSNDLNKKYMVKLQRTWFVFILTSSFMLIGALAISWPSRHSKDMHIYTVIRFMEKNNYAYGMSSREIGVTSTYFTDGKINILPMACNSNHTITPTNLFYDIAAFRKFNAYHGDVPIIVPPEGIRYIVNCSMGDIVKQFGAPKHEILIPDIGMAMIYEASSIRTTD